MDESVVWARLRPLGLTVAVLAAAGLAVPLDVHGRRTAMVVAIVAAQVAWVAYRSNPDSGPATGSRSTLRRIVTMVAAALIGAAACAVAFLIQVQAGRDRGVNPHDAMAVGCVLGIGAGLSVWEWRVGNDHE